MWYLLIGIVVGPALTAIVTSVGTFLVHLIFHVLVFDDSDTTHTFDKFLQKQKAIGPRQPDGKIAVGWHRTWYSKPGAWFKRGWVLAEKVVTYSERSGSRTTYKVYCFGSLAYEAICKELNKDHDKVVTIFEEKLCPWRSTDYSYNDSRCLVPYPRQKEIIDDIVMLYLKKMVAFFFISGKPRLGKTTLSELVGRRLRKETGMKVVKTAINLAAPGKGVVDYFWTRDQDTILILELNEYDVAIKTAIGLISYENKEVNCYASSKTSLNDLFDFFGQQERLVIIATTNDSTLFEKEEYSSFIGRFNKTMAY